MSEQRANIEPDAQKPKAEGEAQESTLGLAWPLPSYSMGKEECSLTSRAGQTTQLYYPALGIQPKGTASCQIHTQARWDKI